MDGIIQETNPIKLSPHSPPPPQSSHQSSCQPLPQGKTHFQSIRTPMSTSITLSTNSIIAPVGLTFSTHQLMGCHRRWRVLPDSRVKEEGFRVERLDVAQRTLPHHSPINRHMRVGVPTLRLPPQSISRLRMMLSSPKLLPVALVLQKRW
jgi:hypothetical protein